MTRLISRVSRKKLARVSCLLAVLFLVGLFWKLKPAENAYATYGGYAQRADGSNPLNLLTVAEGGSSDIYSVTLYSQPTADVHMATNITGSDIFTNNITLSPSSLTFTSANWNVAQNITVSAVNDQIVQGSRQLNIGNLLTSADSNFNNLQAGGIVVNITDNDTPGVTVTQTGGATNVTEGGQTATYTIALQSQPLYGVTVTINPGTNVTVNTTSINFTSSNWNTPQTITVTAVDNAVIDGTHTQVITHAASSSYYLDNIYNGVSINSVTATITDNDSVSITATQSGGSTAVTEGGATDTYTLVLSNQPTANVVVTISGGTQVTPTPTPLTFTSANWNTPQTVTVTAVNDALIEGAHTGTLSHTVTSTDTNYNNFALANISVAVTDDDVAGVTLTQSGGSTSVTEGGATDTYTAVLTAQPSANVTVTPNAGSQLTVSPVLLTFTSANWNTPQTVTVTAVNDVVAQGTRTASITHAATSADSNFNNISVGSVSSTIVDNDSAGVSLVQSDGTTAVTEGGSADTYTLVLTTQPTASVTITPHSADTLLLAVSPASLVFSTSNWNTPKTFSVTAPTDALVQGDHTVSVTHSASSSDTSYNAISVGAVAVAIHDANAPVPDPATVSDASAHTVSSGGGGGGGGGGSTPESLHSASGTTVTGTSGGGGGGSGGSSGSGSSASSTTKTDDSKKQTTEKAVDASSSLNGDKLKAAAPSGDQVSAKAKTIFADVAPGHWAEDAVLGVYKKGIMLGKKDTIFDGEAQTSRAETVAIVLRSLGKGCGTEVNTSFTDVSSTQWFAPCIASAFHDGILLGDPGKKRARPTDPTTRAEIVAMLFRAFHLGVDEKAGLTDEQAASISFTDFDQNQWWASYVFEASRRGILKGYEDNTIRPDVSASRYETAVITLRFLNSLLDL